jgi:hypothetical protein
MNRKTQTMVVAAILGSTVWAWAHDEKDMKAMHQTNSAEFQQMKQLVGKWQGTSTPMGPNDKPGPVATEFHLTAAGSAVEENLMKGTPHEMVDMYTDEGGRLAMTHYCAMGNQPHMVLKSANPHQVNLEMGPTPGIDPNSPHMHMLTLEFPDADHLTERWTNFANGKPNETVVFQLARVK